jgi:O-antigen ligase
MTWEPDRAAGSRTGGAATLPGLQQGDSWLQPRRDPEPDRAVTTLVAGCIALAALVNPKGPGNIAPWDVVALLGLFGVFLWALRHRPPLRVPYGWPMAGIMITGLIAALPSVNPTGATVAVLQELFLLMWCAAVATVSRTPEALRTLLRAWVASAVAWAVLLEFAMIAGLHSIAGTGTRVAPQTGGSVAAGVGTRARLFFDHPNMAGNYFMIAVFIAVASGYPRNRWLRVAACGVLVVAMFLSGSNAALLSLIGGAVVTLFLRVRTRSGMVRALAAVGALAMVLSVAAVEVAVPLVTIAEQSNNPLLKYSIGRGQRSAEARASLFTSELGLYSEGNLLGIGPVTIKETLNQQGASTVKTAHNDYLATLVERGPLGLLAVFALICVVWARLTAIVRRPLPPRLTEAVPMPAALAGACAAFALTSLTHEILHYRWLWTLLGIVAALYLLARQEAGAVPQPDDMRSPFRGGRARAAGWHAR